jgi:predicted nucleic acid-binding protein
VLLDTSGLLCYVDTADSHHAAARELIGADPALVTHSYVLAEFLPLCHARGLDRTRILRFVFDLVEDGEVNVMWVDAALHRAAVVLLWQRLDKTYSLCDAVSFLLMRELRIREALTTDRHFEQEGSVRLLAP